MPISTNNVAEDSQNKNALESKDNEILNENESSKNIHKNLENNLAINSTISSNNLNKNQDSKIINSIKTCNSEENKDLSLEGVSYQYVELNLPETEEVYFFNQDDNSQTKNFNKNSPAFGTMNKLYNFSDKNMNDKNFFSDSCKNDETEFPIKELKKLNELINKPRWIIPVLPKGELEILLRAAIDLAKKNLDLNNDLCQRFYRVSLPTSFKKILDDEAVTLWQSEIHKCIINSCKLFIELCSHKIYHQDCSIVFDILTIVLNPNNKFHLFNAEEQKKCLEKLESNLSDQNSHKLNEKVEVLSDDQLLLQKCNKEINSENFENQEEKEVFAFSEDFKTTNFSLIELINHFGNLGGFEKIKKRLENSDFNIHLIYILLKPFDLCANYLTKEVIEKYFKFLFEKVLEHFENNSLEISKENKFETKNEIITGVIRALRSLASKLDGSYDYVKQFETLRLKTILKLLEKSSFNDKMNALNEINKVISNVSNYSYRQNNNTVNSLIDEEEWLSSDHVAEWVKNNKILQIVLKDNLHQPQYVEKLEKLIRFIIKEKQLTMQDLDDLWAAQCGKHEAIVKNMHDLLAKLAWDFEPEQLDHLFECFQKSWITAKKKQREKLLELIRTLAEDDKDGVMAHKVLNLLWSLAHSYDLPTEIMDQALAAHIKILDYSCCQDRDTQKSEWLDKCIQELTTEESDHNWVIPALKQIREICYLYFTSSNAPNNNMSHQRNSNSVNRIEIISKLQSQHGLVFIITNNLTHFLNKQREKLKINPEMKPNEIYDNNRYTHSQEVKERLNFLRFILKEGQLWLCETQAIQIWNSLIQESVFKEDREEGFIWFSQLMTDEPDLDPELNKKFFENHILKLDPILLTKNGMECFDKFFKVVNLKEEKLILKNNTIYTKNLDLIGIDYLTRIVLNGNDEVSDLAIELIKVTYSNLANCLQNEKSAIIKDFVFSCIERLKFFYATIEILEKNEAKTETASTEIDKELIKMTRFLKLLYEYLNQCDSDYGDERIFIPMLRSFRGKNVTILVRYMQNQSRNNIEDVIINTHSNETISNIKKIYASKIKMNSLNMQIDLVFNGELLGLEVNKNKKLISHLTTKDHFILTARIYKTSDMNTEDEPLYLNSNNNTRLNSEKNNNFSTGNRTEQFNEETEKRLPSVFMSNYPLMYSLLFDYADLGLRLKYKPLYLNALEILKLMPIDKSKKDSLCKLCKLDKNSQNSEWTKHYELLFESASSTKLCYILGVIYSLLMPANNPLSENALEFQLDFIRSGVAYEVQKFITKKNFLENADDLTKVCAYSIVLKISKFVLKTIANYLVLSNLTEQIDDLKNLQKSLEYLQNSNEDYVISQAANRTATSFLSLKKLKKLSSFQFQNYLPNFEMINNVISFIWSTAAGNEVLIKNQTAENLHEEIMNSQADSQSTAFNICKQSLEVLTIMFMLAPNVLLKLIKEKKQNWELFTMDLILFTFEKTVRFSACEQFSYIVTICSIDNDVLKYYISFLNHHLEFTIPKNYKNSSEFFQLYCKLLNNAYISKFQLPEIKKYLFYEIDLLRNVKNYLLLDDSIEEIQLEGHLCITKELVMMLSSEEKSEIGCKIINEESTKNEKVYQGLLVTLMDEYIFTASKVMVAQQKLSQHNVLGSAINNFKTSKLIKTDSLNSNSPYSSLSCIYNGDIDSICFSSSTLEAAFDLIAALCSGCVSNLRYVCDNLTEMFYSDQEVALTEWEYFPTIGFRPSKGFVGLKNGGATCYMNSVLQQLYMIPEVRDGLLSAEGAIGDSNEDFYEDDNYNLIPVLNNDIEDERSKNDKKRKDYNVGVIKHMQAIFGHLLLNKLQYYIPQGFWKHFKLWGDQINLREQHDALEFFNSLVDSIDEGLKTLNYNKLMTDILGGSFADQKICKGCPHRYSREEPFTTLNIDIRNHSNLLESLEQYVKGDLLEGANAYHCEKCNQKVDTVKRLCIKKLPIILTIQLKRFDYDWERSCSIKFNDYFEFPRSLDMEPYTVNGLAKIDGEVIEDIIESENIELEFEINEKNKDFIENKNVPCTKYELCGIVVHSGQASGGHYYSYILHKDENGNKKWFKFDDCDVSDCKLNEDEEMKNQCFGGDYLGEVFDHMLKKLSCRKQKRWWSAYILFYRRIDTDPRHFSLKLNETVSSSTIPKNLTNSYTSLSKQNSGDSDVNLKKSFDSSIGRLYSKIPTPIRRSVQMENIKYMHMRNQFNSEYFNFIKNLTSSNHDQLLNQFNNIAESETSNQTKDENKDKSSSKNNLKNSNENINNSLLTPCNDQSFDVLQQTEISLVCTKLLSKFLFTTCFHTKKSLRGSTVDWYEILSLHLRSSSMIRGWFGHNMLLYNSHRFNEYLLECTSTDVRNAFTKLVMFVAHFALLDGNCQYEIELDDGTKDLVQCGQPMSDCIIQLVLNLLKKEVLENPRHLNQYFNFFYQYCNLGRKERAQLIKLNVPTKFIETVLDDSFIMSIKRQNGEFGRLHQVLSILVRCCDVSSRCKSCSDSILPNPYGFEYGTYITKIPPDLAELIFNKQGYLKKVIEDANKLNETFLFFQFCCWENPRFSFCVLGELIWHIAYFYESELKSNLDLLYHILMMQDSWQKLRIVNVLNGCSPVIKEGILDTILNDTANCQKKAYQCIKFLVSLFTSCDIVNVILQNDNNLKQKWVTVVNWLNEELDPHCSTSSNQFNNFKWACSNQSNENNNYGFVRSNSARHTLAKAIKLCPKDETTNNKNNENQNEESNRIISTKDLNNDNKNNKDSSAEDNKNNPHELDQLTDFFKTVNMNSADLADNLSKNTITENNQKNNLESKNKSTNNENFSTSALDGNKLD